MVFYFTATGNSLYVAKALDEERISIAQAIHDENKIYKADKIGIVCPVFGHEMPPLVKEFMAQSTFETDYFYLVLTFGSHDGGAAELTNDFCQSIGIDPSYINVIMMVDNFLPAFDMDKEVKAEKHVDENLAKIKADIESCKEGIAEVKEEEREIHKIFRENVSKRPRQSGPMYKITEECIGCGICEKICPKGCFTVENQKSIQTPEGCIMCMACIHACPMKAIRLNMPEVNPKARYRNENITLCEIIDANNQGY